MNTLKSYRDLEVWKKSIELAEQVYRLSAKFPVEERFGLTSQIRRAAASVAANIAEGAEREGTRGVTGGGGDFSDSHGQTGHRHDGRDQPGFGSSGNRWSDAQRTQTLAALQSLADTDFPLSLTTDHRAQVTVHGVDVFHPNTGEVRSDGPEGIACWFIDTDYNEESFFVRHAYFLGANDPYSALFSGPSSIAFVRS
jgi:hypothetical protein